MPTNNRDIFDRVSLIVERLEALSEILVNAISEIPCKDENVSKSVGICYLVYDELIINADKLRNIEYH